jgi:uncharacterized protein YkwD
MSATHQSSGAMKRGFLCVSLLVFLAACQTSPPTPARTAMNASATQTLPPATATLRATSTPTASATTPLPTPSVSPPPVASPTLTPTLALTPTTTATPTPVPATVAREVDVSVDNGLNFRAEPSSTGTLLRTLPPGTHLTALGAPLEVGSVTWQNVQTEDGQSGWVAAQFLIDREPAGTTPTSTVVSPPTVSTTPVVTPIAAAGYVYVIAPDGLNLRAQASAASQLVRTLADGQRLQTNGLGLGPGENGITWLNVKTEDNVEGWVSVRFVTTTVPSLAPSVPAVNATDAVQELLNRTNALRRSNGVPPVLLNDDLSVLALEHSQFMAQNGISHVGAGGLRAGQRIMLAGYGDGRPVENIYGGQATIDDAWNYWSTDPPHVAVLLNEYNTVVGIGVYQMGPMTYYTMDFGKPAE